MRRAKKNVGWRNAFTLIELLVVIAIMLVIAALAAAFAPRVSDSTNLTRAVDQLEQWLLTAKMRAKRDGLATGIRFVLATGDTAPYYSQVQYIQQPDALSGGMSVPSTTPGAYQYPPGSGIYYTGGLCISATSGAVQFVGVDFTLGGAALLPGQQFVQAGDYLELRDGGVYLIGSVAGPTTLQLSTAYGQALTLANPTTNYRILRQPRILIGEDPVNLPNNFAVDMSGTTVTNNVLNGPSGFPEILFSPTGAVVGSNAGSGQLYMFVRDITQNAADIATMSGLVAVQCRTGFIGAYSVNTNAALGGPFYYAQTGRESGL